MATYGDTVGSLKLPEDRADGKYSWENPYLLVGNVGEDNRHVLVFTPNELNKYNIVKTEVPVKVNPKPVDLIWNIDDGHEFTYTGKEQPVNAKPDLHDVIDSDEHDIEASVKAEDLVNAGSYTAEGSLNSKNYVVTDETRTINYRIAKSGELKPLNYTEEYFYGTTLKEIYDDLAEKHFDDLTGFAKEYSIDPASVVITKNGKSVNASEIKKYLAVGKNLSSSDLKKTINQFGARFYNKKDFDVTKYYSDYFRMKELVEKHSSEIRMFLKSGMIPDASKYS